MFHTHHFVIPAEVSKGFVPLSVQMELDFPCNHSFAAFMDINYFNCTQQHKLILVAVPHLQLTDSTKCSRRKGKVK